LEATEKGAYVNKTSVGLLVPFVDKKGESSVNVEVFFQVKSYIKTELDDDSFWGIKFGLPFNKL
jgi:hypothetical protein